MFKIINAFLTGGKLVWFRNHKGEAQLEIAHLTAFGDLVAKILVERWPETYSIAVLKPDGIVEIDGQPINKWRLTWKYYKEKSNV
jgi:hypothetical protein